MSTPKEVFRARVLLRDGARCCLAGDGHECHGRLEAHHVVPVQSIKNQRRHWILVSAAVRERPMPPEKIRLVNTPLNELISDADNGVMVCHTGHSSPWAIPEPEHVGRFRAKYGF